LAAGYDGTLRKGSSKRFRRYEGLHEKDKHLRLTKYMLDHPKYVRLSASAKVLYNYMKLWACGRDTVEYSASMAKDFIKSNTTFFKARDELIEGGFIEYINSHRAQHMRETAIYQFSAKWWENP